MVGLCCGRGSAATPTRLKPKALGRMNREPRRPGRVEPDLALPESPGDNSGPDSVVGGRARRRPAAARGGFILLFRAAKGGGPASGRDVE